MVAAPVGHAITTGVVTVGVTSYAVPARRSPRRRIRQRLHLARSASKIGPPAEEAPSAPSTGDVRESISITQEPLMG